MTTHTGYRVRPGRPLPLGATKVPEGVNFAVHTTGARGVRLVLMDPADGRTLADLPFPDEYRVGDVHSMVVVGLDPRVHYGFLPEGANGPVLDPYARALAGGEVWGERPRYRSALLDGDFDWDDDRSPRIPARDLVVYELHVRGFTRHGSAGVARPGTFAGVGEKIPYLTELGVNCVELLPVFEFDETDNVHVSPDTGRPLVNLWGYNTLGFFAPKAAYASDPRGDGPAREFRELVRDLHRAGIEVVLDVVFNHTGEGNERGPVLSFKGLAEPVYYMLGADGAHLNLTATGNTVNANHPAVRGFVLDCLRYWVTEFHVDGFRFDMAPILARGSDGRVLDDPPLLEAIAHDPVLADVRLIAEPWDATGLDLTGRFPRHGGRWTEWNGRFRDHVRRFLTGRADAADVAPRLLGSPDLYAGDGPAVPVNFVTCHDGFTLADWASYDDRHNTANGEDGRDGIPDNDSWNCGHEGPTDDPRVTDLRDRQTRSAMLMLLLGTGTPMFPAGDEFGRTQHGNNNAYPQDNEIGWVDWTLAEKNEDFLDFVRRCLAFRKAHPAVTDPAGSRDLSRDAGVVEVVRHGTAPDGRSGDTVYLAVNATPDARPIRPPDPPAGTQWHVFAATGEGPEPCARPAGREPPLVRPPTLAGRSALVLVAKPTTEPDRETRP
ncbi:glycogen debranching protein [Actinomadura oligospora]|uniref:glycogen debranching protein n=1 Tax=Actinomadura oligospora TaxID=111804 RepID=UPI0004B81FF5|nr:alpha-amylase family glycosyl hydrolase [Actinomadura oligospora]